MRADLAIALALAAGAPCALAATEPASWPPYAQESPPVASPAQRRLYLLSFTEKPISEVARTILGEVLREPYLVDPGLDQPITLNVEARLTPGELLAEFEAALASKGARIERAGGQLLVLPSRPPTTAPRVRTQPPSAPRPLSLGLALGALAAIGAMVGVAICLVLGRLKGRAFIGLPGRRDTQARRQAVLNRLRVAESVDLQTLLAAKRQASKEERPLEHILVEYGLVSEDRLVEAYARVTGCAVWSPLSVEPLALEQLQGVPWAYQRGDLIVLAISDNRVRFAAADPLDDEAFAALAAESGRALEILVARPSDLHAAQRLTACDRLRNSGSKPAAG